MRYRDSFDVQIGSVYSLEPEILDRASRFANAASTNLGIKNKRGLAGPNDILYLLASVDVWQSLLPFAAEEIAIGALGGLGKSIWDSVFKSKMQLQIESLVELQVESSTRISAVQYTLQQLIDKITETPRYWQPESEVRFGLPTATNDERNDVGFVIKNPARDPVIAVVALNIIGPEVMKIVEEVREKYQVKGFYDTPQVTGNITFEEDGSIHAVLNAEGEKVNIVRKIG